jgi:hypothetical protein
LSDGSTCVQRIQVVDEWTTLKSEWFIIRGDSARRYQFNHRLYSGFELRTAMEAAGFEVSLFGDFAGNEYGPQSLRLIAVGRKPSSYRVEPSPEQHLVDSVQGYQPRSRSSVMRSGFRQCWRTSEVPWRLLVSNPTVDPPRDRRFDSCVAIGFQRVETRPPRSRRIRFVSAVGCRSGRTRWFRRDISR